MVKEKNKLTIFIPVFIMLIIIGFAIMSTEDDLYLGDYYFLYNRARQLLNCIQDGVSINFYYQDFNGVGYGSTFFYGYLTLLPFVPLLHLGGDVFLNAYMLVASLIFCFGTLYLVSRFTDKYIEITSLFLLSTFVVEMFSAVVLIVNFLAIGLSYFFLGTCIDFFRDKKKFIVSSLLFFLILNTHLITAVISVCISAFLFIVYFDKERIKEYLIFFITTVIFCLYNIVVFFKHIDKAMYLNNTTFGFVDFLNNKSTLFCASRFSFYDVLILQFTKLSSVKGYALFGVGVLIVSLLVLFSYYKTLSKKELFCISCFIVGFFVGITEIWTRLLSIFNIPIQFPMRYMFYLLLGFYIIVGRRINKKWLFGVLFCLSLPNLFFRFFTTLPDPLDVSLENLYNLQLMNSEYLYEDFDFDTERFEKRRNEVVDEDGTQYIFVKDKNMLYVKYDTDKGHTITVPKLYYNGYVCKNMDTDSFYPIERGESQFISITLPANSRGVYVVYYEEGMLKYLQIVDYIIIVLASGLFLFGDFIKFKSKKLNKVLI